MMLRKASRCVVRFQHGPRRFTQAPATAAHRTHDYVGIATLSSICVATLGLGVWQLQRYSWKVDLIEDIKKRAQSPPVTATGNSLFEQKMTGSDLAGYRIKITGTFDHLKEIELGPRSAPNSLVGGPAQGMATNPQGLYVITPFKTDDGKIIFVNRGWVRTGCRDFDRPAGRVTLNCVIVREEEAGRFAPVNKPESGRLFWLEGIALTTLAGLPNDTPVVILEVLADDESEGENSFPYSKRATELSEQYVMPLTHLVYAATWLSLAAAGFVMTYFKFRKGRRGGRRLG